MVAGVFPNLVPGSPQDDGSGSLSVGMMFYFINASPIITGLRFWAEEGDIVAPRIWDFDSPNPLAIGPSVVCVAGWNDLPFYTYTRVSGTYKIAGVHVYNGKRYSAIAGQLPQGSGYFSTDTQDNGKDSRYAYDHDGLTWYSNSSSAWYGIQILWDTAPPNEPGLPTEEPEPGPSVSFVTTRWNGITEEPIDITIWDGAAERSTTLSLE